MELSHEELYKFYNQVCLSYVFFKCKSTPNSEITNETRSQSCAFMVKKLL